VEKLKRLRFCRFVCSTLVFMVGLPIGMLATAAPGRAQSNPAPAVPPASPQTAPAAATALQGTLLVWPFDSSKLTPDDANIGYTAANDLVGALMGATGFTAVGLRPDPVVNTPMVQRVIQEDTSGEIQRIITTTAPTSDDAARVARALGYDMVMTGTVDAASFDAGAHTATASLTAMVYDARQAGTPRLIATYTGTGTSAVQPAQVSAATAEDMAAQAAARQIANQVAPGAAMARRAARVQRHGSNSSHILPIIIGVAAVALVAVAASHSSSHSNTALLNNNQLAPPTNAVAQQAPSGSTFAIDLRWTASTAGTGVFKYVVHRIGPLGDTIIDTKQNFVDQQVFTSSDTGAVAGQSYRYYVVAVGFNGQTSSQVFFQTANGSTVIVAGQPQPPTNLSARLAGSSVSLTWNPSADAFVSGYQVLRSLSPASGFVIISAPGLTANTFTDNSPNLAHGTVYYYTVRSLSGGNPPVSSVNSNVVGVRIP
jgi:hypothetical protein